MRLPEWTNEPDVPALVLELHRLRQSGVWGLQSSAGVPIPRLREIARALTEDAGSRSDFRLINDLFRTISASPTLTQKLNLDALHLYFGISGEPVRHSSRWRREQTAQRIFHESYAQFRRPDVGSERALLTNFALVLEESVADRSVRDPDLPVEQDSAPVTILVGDLPGESMAYRERTYLSDAIHDAFRHGRSALICPIGGSRGVGKTQLAAEYARWCRENGWPVVAWLNAEDEDQIVSGLAAVAERLGHRMPGDTATEAAHRARRWFEEAPGPCLVVFDNALSAEVVDRWRPKVGTTRTIVTSSVFSVTNLGPPIEVGVFDRDEAIAYLVRCTGLASEEQAALVAEELGCLPLALGQASWTIRKQGLSYRDFVDRMREIPLARLLPAVPGTAYGRSTAATVTMSAAYAETIGAPRLIIDLLTVMSPSGIRRRLMERCLSPTAEPGHREITDIDEAFGNLREASLITFSTDRNSVIMHRVVQMVLQDRARSEGTLDACLAAAVQGMTALLPLEQDAWRERALGAELIDHIEVLWHALDPTGDGDSAPSATSLLSLRVWAVRQLTLAVDLARAARVGIAAADDCDRLVGPRDPLSLQARHYLGNVYRNQDRLSDASAQYEHVIALRTQVLGPNHPDTLLSRNNLALTYRRANRVGEAIVIHEEVLDARRTHLGPEHPDTLESQNNLARAYHVAGRLQESIALFRLAVQVRARTLGSLHPLTINSRHNLAAALLDAGRTRDALTIYTRVLNEREGVLGREHPSTLASHNSLADANLRLSRPAESLELFRTTAQLRARVLGSEHPDTIMTLVGVASSLRALGDDAASAQLFRRLLDMCERVLSPGHPLTDRVRTESGSALLDTSARTR